MVALATIYLFDETVDSFEKAVASRHGWVKEPLAYLDSKVFEIWTRLSYEAATPPDWIDWLSSRVALPKVEPNRNSSAVVLTRVSGRIFAICFGYGHTLIRKHLVEEDIGVSVGANYLEANHVVEAETRSWGANALTIRSKRVRGGSFQGLVQAQYARQLSYLNVDVLDELGNRRKMKGGRGLATTIEVPLPEIPGHLAGILALISSGRSNESLAPFMRPQRIPMSDELVGICENELQALLNEGNSERIDIDTSIWPSSDLDAEWYFQLGDLSEAIAAPTWEFVWPLLDRLGLDDVDQLKTAFIRCVVREVGLDETDSVWRLITYETEVEGIKVCRSMGHWHVYNQRYTQWLTHEIRRIEQRGAPFTMPDWRSDLRKEGDYAKDVAQDRNWLLLDGKTWNRDGNRGRFEPCDLLTDTGAFVHIKELDGTPSVGYVLGQATISARNFDSRHEIRNHILALERDHFGMGLAGVPRDVVVVIATDYDGPLAEVLPLGAKTRIVEAFGELESMQFRPHLLKCIRIKIPVAMNQI